MVIVVVAAVIIVVVVVAFGGLYLHAEVAHFPIQHFLGRLRRFQLRERVQGLGVCSLHLRHQLVDVHIARDIAEAAHIQAAAARSAQG